MAFFITLIIFALVFLLLDAIWLKGMRGFYDKQVGDLLLKKPNVKAAVIFYLLYATIVSLLVLYPAVVSDGALAGYVALNTALLGLLAYATYDLTNMATLKDWSWKLVGVDIVWGMLATSGAATLTYVVVNGWF
jgi:uncharacterized membrane protein